MPYKDRQFIREKVEVDGETFDHCVFEDCELIFRGGTAPSLMECKLVPPTSWVFEDSGANTLHFLHLLGSANPGAAATFERFLEAINANTERVGPEQTFDYLAGHPQHAFAVAKIAAIFAVLEVHLCALFAWMLHCPPNHAAAAYYQLQNNKARLDMIRGLLTVLHTDDERKGVTSILEMAVECARIRNTYCHAIWQRRGLKLYLTEKLDTHYPHGQRRLIKVETITSEADLVERYAREIQQEIEKLSTNRPLRIAEGVIRPSFLPKFLSLSRDPAQADDQPKTNSEEP